MRALLFRRPIVGVSLSFLAVIAIAGICGCQDRLITASNNSRASAKENRQNVALSLIGYNYTTRYIDQFSADGVDGGNIFVSTQTGGGGGRVCCVSYIRGISPWYAKVRWQAGACTYNNKIDTNGQRLYEIYPYFKELEVKVSGDIPADPHYFEVHFYPDGHVEALITEQSSGPRVQLKADRQDKTVFGKCQNDKRPIE